MIAVAMVYENMSFESIIGRNAKNENMSFESIIGRNAKNEKNGIQKNSLRIQKHKNKKTCMKNNCNMVPVPGDGCAFCGGGGCGNC